VSSGFYLWNENKGNLTENHAKINKNLCSGAKIIKTRLEMTSK
jgi:hypothetical protein